MQESKREKGEMMKTMTDIDGKIKTQGRIDAKNSCWVTGLLEKKDEEKRVEVEHQKLISRMIESAEGGTNRSFAQDQQTNGVDRRSADSEGGRRRCQAVGHM